MIDLKWVNEILNTYIRPHTFPVAAKMCFSAEELPEKTRIPSRDLNIKIPLCQGIAMARRYGWVIAIGKEDQSCPFGALTLGFLPPSKGYLNGSAYTPSTKKAAAKTANLLSRLEYGKYAYLLVAPLQRATFDPDIIIIYGNPAQVGRLIQATLLSRGGELVTPSMGEIACSNIIARTINRDECQYVVAGAGDRVFALTQDDEMTFTMPLSKVEVTLKSLYESHKKAENRYPTTSYLHFEPRFPDSLYHLMDSLKKGD